MSASSMIYATCVGLLLAPAAILLERPLRTHVGGTRLLWMGMLACALVWPAIVVMLGRHPSADGAAAIASARQLSLSSPAATGKAAPSLFTPPMKLPALVPASANIDHIGREIAIATPLLMLTLLLIEAIRIARARRRWRRHVIDNIPVFLSDNFGPAIVGVWHPEIVIPAWALALPPDQRILMLTHESEHLAKHDSRWLFLAFVAVLIAPWNIGLWWLLRHFRLAMEIDCDHRVLRRGYDVERYGNLLIGIGRHSTGRSLLAADFAERRSVLRARINSMTTGIGITGGSQWGRTAAGMALMLGACLLSPSRSDGQRIATSAFAQKVASNSLVAVNGAVPPSVRTMLKQFSLPTTNAPSVTVRFSGDTIRVGEQLELVMVTWFPRALRDSARRAPVIAFPLPTGPSIGLGPEHGSVVRSVNVGGQWYDRYVVWRSFSTIDTGRIVSPPALLTYSVPSAALYFPPTPEERRVMESGSSVAVVRPEN